MKSILLAFSVLLSWSAVNDATADQWGCEVLLCAASSDPSWHGIPECQPPMRRLIKAMKRPGFSWPTCPEGGAGKPGFEMFEDCPSGWTPTDDGRNGTYSTGLSRCTRTGSDCRKGRPFEKANDGRLVAVEQGGITRVYRDHWRCEYVDSMPRPRREKPYYFDVVDEATTSASRVYFDLHD